MSGLLRGPIRIRQFWQRMRKEHPRGTVAVLTAVCLTTMFAFVALSVDIGFVTLTKTQMQSAADAAALAGAQELNGIDTPEVVRTNALAAVSSVIAANSTGNYDSTSLNIGEDVQFGKQTYNFSTGVTTFEWGDQYTPYNVIRVTTKREKRTAPAGSTVAPDQRLGMFFSPVIGVPKVGIRTSAVATFRPRDIMVVLDFSASMNDDSTFEGISRIGRSAVEANLLQCYAQLGSPKYGTKLTDTPNFVVFSGQAASGTTIPHIDVTYKGTQVAVVSTKTITSVKLQFSDGTTQTISGSATTGTFKGSSWNNGKVISVAWVKSGSNGTNGEQFSFATSNFITALGLNTVAYPYSGGSWTEFINYVNSSSGQNFDAGYRWKPGYLNWMNYLFDIRPEYADTPVLWKTSSYPAEALKSGVDTFTSFLTQYAAEDRVGLAVYSTSTGAKLEYGMTNDISKLSTTTRQRQPGHYDPYTNIYAGMKLAREELVSNARPKAFRLMVVMTDGLANRPTNTTTAKDLVRQEAQLAKDNKIMVLTISLGFKADPTLMQEVADIADGIHYNVPGGATTAAYTDGMNEAFRQIGASRPLRLIKDPGN